MGRKKADDIPVGAIGCLIVVVLILSPFAWIGQMATGSSGDGNFLSNAVAGMLLLLVIGAGIYLLCCFSREYASRNRINANRKELEQFINSDRQLEPLDVDLCLDANEQAYYYEEDVEIGQLRSVYKRDGAGIGFRVTKGIGIGSYHSEGRSFPEWRRCDRGDLILTNRNLIYRGHLQPKMISLGKILSIDEFTDAVKIGQRNERKNDLFFVRNPSLWGYLIRNMRNGTLHMMDERNHVNTRITRVETLPSPQLPPPFSSDK